MTTRPAPLQLAHLIVDAQRDGRELEQLAPELMPKDFADAYQTQQEILRLLDATVAGWKIGSKSPTGHTQGSPLPSECLFASSTHFDRADFGKMGFELEIAFRFGRDFLPRAQPYSPDEVLNGIESMASTVEIVTSHFAKWPNIEPLLQLSDMLNHGALIVGEFVPFNPEFDFLKPALKLTFDGQDITPTTIGNPAGDPRRLLPWLVNHHTTQGSTLPAGLVITTGTYTGVYNPPRAGRLVGQIEGLPTVALTVS
ncbi:2-keto-4-pentenoate hydratase [Pseudomonas gingeri]|uniref:2-keto-4-pentenoate hydratase n=1 Tax=Pseudomonas gingeri TaxID=117681 RepID=UPI003528A846